MSIRTACPKCGKVIDVPGHFAGKSGHCKACGAGLTIPGGPKWLAPGRIVDVAPAQVAPSRATAPVVADSLPILPVVDVFESPEPLRKSRPRPPVIAFAAGLCLMLVVGATALSIGRNWRARDKESRRLCGEVAPLTDATAREIEEGCRQAADRIADGRWSWHDGVRLARDMALLNQALRPGKPLEFRAFRERMVDRIGDGLDAEDFVRSARVAMESANAKEREERLREEIARRAEASTEGDRVEQAIRDVDAGLGAENRARAAALERLSQARDRAAVAERERSDYLRQLAEEDRRREERLRGLMEQATELDRQSKIIPALGLYRQIVESYPATPEARRAAARIADIRASRKKPVRTH
jgi:hypothetical protein